MCSVCVKIDFCKLSIRSKLVSLDHRNMARPSHESRCTKCSSGTPCYNRQIEMRELDEGERPRAPRCSSCQCEIINLAKYGGKCYRCHQKELSTTKPVKPQTKPAKPAKPAKSSCAKCRRNKIVSEGWCYKCLLAKKDKEIADLKRKLFIAENGDCIMFCGLKYVQDVDRNIYRADLESENKTSILVYCVDEENWRPHISIEEIEEFFVRFGPFKDNDLSVRAFTVDLNLFDAKIEQIQYEESDRDAGTTFKALYVSSYLKHVAPDVADQIEGLLPKDDDAVLLW